MKRESEALVLKKGAFAQHRDRTVVINAIVDFNLANVKDLVSGEIQEVRIDQLRPISQPKEEPPRTPQSAIPEQVREGAEFKLEVIRPLLNCPGRTRAKVVARASEYGLHANTIYGWLRRYDGDQEFAALLRKRRADTGTLKLSKATEEIVSAALENLKNEDRSITKIHKDIKERIENANGQLESQLAPKQKHDALQTVDRAIIRIPSPGTIRNRLAAVPRKQTFARLHGRQAADHLFDPVLESFPGAIAPLAIVQIDHVLLDITILDDARRRSIGKPWLTATFDVFGRVVTGIEDSLDPPGAMSTGLCIASSIFPKEELISQLGCSGEWPVWGKPTAIHGDNAFRINMLKKACHDHGIDLIWRPIKHPHFGGHIERWCGTLGKSIHFLPGTTFSNPRDRGIYDSEGKATFTRSEFRQWLVQRIIAYHAEPHSQLGMSPMARYRQGIFKGTDAYPPTGLQPRIVNPVARRRIQLDLMPLVQRTIQRHGVQIDKIFYYGDALRRWINAPDPDHPKLKREFDFRRFYRDISSLWFYDPELDEYFEIPTRDSTFPHMSIWELREVKRYAKSEGIRNSQVDQEYIKNCYRRMREIEDTAAKNTKAARRQEARRAHWAAAPKPRLATDVPSVTTIAAEPYKPVGEFKDDDE